MTNPEKLAQLNAAIENLSSGKAVAMVKTADKEIRYHAADLTALRKERDALATAISRKNNNGIRYWGFKRES